MKVAITDYAFEDLSIEQAFCDAAGCELAAMRTGSEEERIALVRDADAVITQFAPVNAAVIGAMTKNRVIVRYGIGVDNVDLAAAAARGIPVCNVPDYCIDEVADHAMAMILDLTRKITANAAKVRSGGWGLAVPSGAMYALKSLTVGVVGFGRIGREVVARLGAFKCKVLVFDPVVDAGAIRASGAAPVGLEELLRSSDLVTLHCPSNDKTRYLINADNLARMKPGVMLVNTSRGTLVKTEDLAAALASGQVSAAALDVTDPEPPGADYPLRTLDNVVINSHVASCSAQAVCKLKESAVATVAIALRGEKLPNVVNGVGV
ncbi:MAG: C-terminal binding protein [Pirellulales bacterium]|nr:C-terminal binding protein [Pirellulales bacterium]